MTNSAGAVIQTYDYDAFGNITAQTGALTAKYAYKTKEYSPETGLVFFGRRYYNPLIGRFITKDPLGQIDGPNVYIYCNNDPVNKNDPWGNQWERLVPRYGNWGGPGWTGGQETPYEKLTPEQQEALLEPIDEMDALFKTHDLCYSKARVKRDMALNNEYATKAEKEAARQQFDKDIQRADRELGKNLHNLNSNPGNWSPPAPNPVWAGVYRSMAQTWFW